MTTENGARASVPYDEAMNPMLQDPHFADYYLSDALREEPNASGSLVAALSDIIRANANSEHCMKAFASVAVVMEHLSSEQLLGLIDLIEEVLPPQVRTFYVNHGTFQSMRELAGIIAKQDPVILDGIEKDKSPVPQGMRHAEAAIQKALPDVTESESYLQMNQTLAAA